MRALFALQRASFSRSVPAFSKENAHKIHKMPLPEYFEELMRRRVANKSGYINLPTANFNKMVAKCESAEDLETMKDVLANYIGHRNILPNKSLDALMHRALELEQPQAVFEIMKNHAELLYHPSVKVMEAFLRLDWEHLKPFFEETRGNFLMHKPQHFHDRIIKLAHKNGDKQIVIDAYLDCMDYKKLSDETFTMVLESMSYEEHIDHVLFGHVTEQMDARKLDHRMHAAVYYLQVNGGLTAVDRLNELAASG